MFSTHGPSTFHPSEVQPFFFFYQAFPSHLSSPVTCFFSFFYFHPAPTLKPTLPVFLLSLSHASLSADCTLTLAHSGIGKPPRLPLSKCSFVGTRQMLVQPSLQLEFWNIGNRFLIVSPGEYGSSNKGS